MCVCVYVCVCVCPGVEVAFWISHTLKELFLPGATDSETLLGSIIIAVLPERCVSGKLGLDRTGRSCLRHVLYVCYPYFCPPPPPTTHTHTHITHTHTHTHVLTHYTHTAAVTWGPPSKARERLHSDLRTPRPRRQGGHRRRVGSKSWWEACPMQRCVCVWERERERGGVRDIDRPAQARTHTHTRTHRERCLLKRDIWSTLVYIRS